MVLSGHHKKQSAIELFFSWIEAFKKIVPQYEWYEHMQEQFSKFFWVFLNN